MATPLFGSPDESNRYANTEAIDGIGFVALAKTYGQENLAGGGRTFHRDGPSPRTRRSL
jgi:hypothetical protein